MRMAHRNRSIGRALALAPVVLSLTGCAWVGLGWGAFSYPTTQRGESANVVVNGDWAYASRGADGIEIIGLGLGRRHRLMSLPASLASADDLATADGFLFVLDAQPPGELGVFSLADPAEPVLVGAPVAVDVGPFSGVSAVAGRVVVSGGTSAMSLWHYDTSGNLAARIGTADLGRGQPDALLSGDGHYAYVSTHEWGPHFSLKIADLTMPAIPTVGVLGLGTYGFTPGGAKPANFPVESAQQGSTLYVADAQGLNVIDVSDAAAPRAVAVLDPGIQPVNVDVLDGVAALVGSAPGPRLVFVDVREPAHPKVLQSFPLPEGSLATGVALTASHAVVAAHARGTLLFDRSKGAWESLNPLQELQP